MLTREARTSPSTTALGQEMCLYNLKEGSTARAVRPVAMIKAGLHQCVHVQGNSLTKSYCACGVSRQGS